MSLLIQLVQLWKSPNSGILGVFVGNFQFGSNLTRKCHYIILFLDTFVLKIEHLAISIILSTFRYLFHAKMIMIVFYVELPITLPFGVKHHFCHVHHYCHNCVSCPPLFYFINYLKTRFFTRI